MYGYVYITENLINHKRYIGQHKSEIFDDWYKGSGTLLFRAFERYGFDNFQTSILEICDTQEELNASEVFWISEFNAVEDRDFYNIAAGGTGGDTLAGFSEKEREIHAEHTRIATKKLWQNPEYVRAVEAGKFRFWSSSDSELLRKKKSESSKRQWQDPEFRARVSKAQSDAQKRPEVIEARRASLQKYYTAEKRAEVSRRVSGSGNPMYGHVWTEEQLQHAREAQLGKKVSEETRRKTSESLKKLWTDEKRKEASVKMLGGKNRAARKVVCVETEEVFDTICAAGEAFGYKNPYIISDSCKEGCAIRGHHWMYYEDWIKLQNQGDAS